MSHGCLKKVITYDCLGNKLSSISVVINLLKILATEDILEENNLMTISLHLKTTYSTPPEILLSK